MNEFITLFDNFRAVFTAPSFLHFQAVVLSLWALPLLTDGQVSLARIWLASRTSQHWDATCRFVRAYAWQPDELARRLTLLVLAVVASRLPVDRDGKPLLLVGVDETLDEHVYAKKIFGVSQHYNHTAKAGQSRYRIGHGWVTLSVLTASDSGWVRAFAVNIVLYIARKSCSSAPYKSKRELATDLLEQLSHWVGQQYAIVVVGDGYYACRGWLAQQRNRQRRVVTRLRSDARVYELASKPPKSKRGRPKVYGPKVSLARRALAEQKFEAERKMKVYGREHRVRLRKLVCLWRGLEGPISVVIVQGIGKSPFYLLDTDPQASAVETLQYYAARHAVEQPYEDLKQDGGLGGYRGRSELGVRRFAMLAVVAHTLLRLMEIVPELRAQLPEIEEPWRKELEHMTTGQIRQAISKLLLKEYARTGNFINVREKAGNGEKSQTTEIALRRAA